MKNTNKYYIVVNSEEQYSVWSSLKQIPLGWRTVGQPQDKEKCIIEIEKLWTDMRPLSVREKMQ